MTYMETSGPPHYIRNKSHPSPFCDCGKKHSYLRHVMQSYDCWSLETLRNEDGIKEGDVMENVTYLTVSQYFNQNLRSPLYSDLPTWLNPKPRGYGTKKYSSRVGAEKVLDPMLGDRHLGACSPRQF